MLRTRIRAGLVAGIALSLFFAGLLAIVQSFDLFVDAWTPKMGESTSVTIRVPYGPRIVRDQTSSGPASVAYGHARVIVAAGTKLVEHNPEHRAAAAYEALRRPPTGLKILAFVAVNFTLGMILTVYLRRFGQSRLRLLRTQIGIYAAILLVMVATKLMLLYTALPEFWVPVAALPLWISLAFDRRTGFLVSLVLAFVTSSLLRFDLVLLMVVFVRGMAATLFFLDRKHPRQMLPAGTLAGVVACFVYGAVAVIFEGRFDILADLSEPGQSIMVANFGGGLLSGIAAVLLRDPVGRLLGVVSRDRLLDLSDLEQPLLQKMAREAPGSWEHARSMANLAEAAASAIGADALLVRVGAYYHDVGKTLQPKYFVENLAPGEDNPHDELEPDVSADAIMAHVLLGAKLLRDRGIPEPVVEFCYMHHGTQVVEYFWHHCLEMGNPKGLTEDHFRYPGMKPQTKETAILMLVDSIEAASRTIDPPEREKFEEMIQRIIFTKVKAGQLDESGLTVTDLRALQERMSDTLINMFHHRIPYPWQEQARPASHYTTPVPGSLRGMPAAPAVAASSSASRIEVRPSASSIPADWAARRTGSSPSLVAVPKSPASSDAPGPALVRSLSDRPSGTPPKKP
jgi:cyclic-di-AMP phosphodiesterase PgpH